MATITPPPPSFLMDIQQQQQQQQQQHQQQQEPLIAPSFSSSSSSSSLCPSSGLDSHPYFDASSTLQAMLLLDVTTVHGLVLYTVYLLHRLRFFRWRDTKAISSFLYRHLSLPRVHSRAFYSDPTVHTEQQTDHPPSVQDSKTCNEESSPSSLVDQRCQLLEPRETTDSITTTKHTICINDKLPAEIMILIFEYLTSSRILQCMLVCRSWYQLLGPGVWRNPRVLWSRHWSRFYPILTIPNAATSCYTAPSSASSSSSLLSPASSPDTDEDVDMTSSVVSSGQLFTDRAMAGIHELDRQEIEHWIEWKKRDKIRRRKTIKRRRILKQRQATSPSSSSFWSMGSGRAHCRRRISDLEANHGTDSEEDRSRHRQRRIHPNDSSDESEEEDDRDHISFGNHHQRSRRDNDEDLDDDSGTDSDYDPSDDESTLLKVVQGIDYLQSILHRQNQSTTHRSSSPTSSPSSFPLSRTLARLRRKQSAKESRLRMLHLHRRNGLPHAFPLAACGQWIQVINLHQETPYPQRTNPQSLVHPSTPQPRPRPRPAAVASTEGQGQQGGNVQDPAQLHEQQQQPQQPQQPGADRPGFFSSLFGTDRFFQQSPEPNPHRPTNEAQNMDPIEQPRLQSRRDYVTDRTLATILKHCPGLCRLLVSECAGITDRGLELLRNSECVRRGTLVSLHMAGCFKITDKGLLTLATGRSDWDDSDLESVSDTTGTELRLESLDFAGCFQISDRGLVPLLKACGTRLEQLRVSDCDLVTSQSVTVLAQWCSRTKWLDLARSGPLTGSCLSLLARRCSGLEWLNLARSHPGEEEVKDDGKASPEGQTPEEADVGLDGEGDADQEENAISDDCIALICESCPQLQLLDLSYIPTLTNLTIEAMSQTANALVCLTIIGCPGITSLSLVYLAKLRNTSGRLGCITMGDAQGISERDIEQIMQGTLSGWQKSLVDETSLGEILGRSWDE